jgi:hypothetical protein
MRAAESCSLIYPGNTRLQQCTVGIPAITFGSAFQQQSEWCWAACISMVFNYYHHPVSQARIVKETWETIVNMPAQNDDILNDLNKSWTDDRGNDFTSSGDMLSVSVETAADDLKGSRPLIIGALGHAMVLTALTANVDRMTGQYEIVAATVRDPWPTNGVRKILSPQEWFNIQFAARITVEDA